jgi:hypothetical protein
MSVRRDEERNLLVLLSAIEAATKPSGALVAALLRQACPRFSASFRPSTVVRRLIEAEAWLDLGFWLIEWELPDWGVHRLSCDDISWNCSIGKRGLPINWAEDVAEFQHETLSLAVFGVLVQAQLNKLRGLAQSSIAPFRRLNAAAAGH